MKQARMPEQRRRALSRGSATIEFALVTPLFVSLFLGTIGFGHTFLIYSRLEETVRAGARYASTRAYDTNAGDPEIPACPDGKRTCQFTVTGGLSSTFLTAVRNMTVYGTPAPADSDQPIVEGVSVDNVQVVLGVIGKVPGTTSVSVPVSVSVSVSNFSFNMLLGTVTLAGKPRTEFSYVGAYAPIKSN